MSFNFLLVNFIVSAVSDLLLNYLTRVNSRHIPKPIVALRSYFTHYNNALLTAVYAGLTVVAVVLVAFACTKLVFGFTVPRSRTELIKLLVLALPLGYGADVFIYKYKVFGTTLDPYYKAAGAGLWGALAFAFSLIISYSLTS
jgi:hypothetical protein